MLGHPAQGSELFIVEGDSAGGSAKQARNRATQAVLPLRGKILNVANATKDKLAGNQQLADLMQALGAGTGASYREDDLRYEKIIIMTDADVDGAHIASLAHHLLLPPDAALIDGGHLYLAVPPLYKLAQGAKVAYARNDQHKEELLKGEMCGRAKVEVRRFKGLGEMLPAQLKETTMDPGKRTATSGERRREPNVLRYRQGRRTTHGQQARRALQFHHGTGGVCE